jgi:hypothetical protein
MKGKKAVTKQVRARRLKAVRKEKPAILKDPTTATLYQQRYCFLFETVIF